jgi:hypothetical protein
VGPMKNKSNGFHICQTKYQIQIQTSQIPGESSQESSVDRFWTK